jgi:tetratricopeptide (TPR) repeat protein
MNKWLFIISVLILLILSELCKPIENPLVRSPIVSSTVPPSNTSSGLIQTPNPFDTSGNLVITGNVTGGKHFRGPVPYGSPTNFQSPLGTSYLDSFLRYSAPDSAALDNYGQDSFSPFYSPTISYRPFFSPTGTVASTRAGLSDIFMPTSTEIGVHSSSIRSNSDDAGTAWFPLSRTPWEMEKLIYNEIGRSDVRRQTPDYRRQIQTTSEAPAPSFAVPREPDASASQMKPSQPAYPYQQSQRYPKVFPSNVAELDQLISKVENNAKIRPTQTDKQLNVYQEIQQRLDDLSGSKSAPSIVEETQDLSYQSTTANKIPITNYQSPDKSYEDKFNWYMQVAQLYLTQGRYYRAADCFTLASICKPGDALAYAGKSQALFAAGEYMTSALFLTRALQAMPGYAGVKVNIVDIVGDESKLEQRLADIEERLKISGAAELQFLLGYIYYQLDKLDSAQKAIEAAYKSLPDSKAVDAVKKAVDEAISRR